MPRTIWNEGRVVGYSAYEMYIKQALAVNPNHEPASEKEWLASMVAMGSSMLLKVEPDPQDSQYDGLHYRDIQFPESSRLCAANTIMASLFIGEGGVKNGSAWAYKVIDYGPLIQNNSTNSPYDTIKPNGNIPPANINDIDNKAIASKIKEYMKIVDGIVIQPGTWVTNPNTPPQKDFKPTLSEYPRLRISFSERINETFFLLLTGFTNRTVVAGVAGFDTAVNTFSPQDGDFLGPWAFPWSNKIIFSMPTAFANYFMTNNYTRELTESTDEIAVKSEAIIDLKQNHDKNNQSHYFETENSESLLKAKVTKINTLGKDAAVLATYMHSDGNTKLPPALYAALINNTGSHLFEPIDCVAPGILHMYHGELFDSNSIPAKKAELSTDIWTEII